MSRSANSNSNSEVTLTLIVTSMNDITSLKSYFIFGSTAQSDLQYNALSVKQQCTKNQTKILLMQICVFLMSICSLIYQINFLTCLPENILIVMIFPIILSFLFFMLTELNEWVYLKQKETTLKTNLNKFWFIPKPLTS